MPVSRLAVNVIGLLFFLGLLGVVSCQRIPVDRAKARSSSNEDKINAPVDEGTAITLAYLADPAINESSGIVASHTTPGHYWTHNDSGDGPFIYAFASGGERRGVWRVTNAHARDWEDIAAGPGPEHSRNYLYIGDIGDNGGRQSEITVYRVPEPKIAAEDAGSTKGRPRFTEAAEVIRLRYPGESPNAETLLVHPQTGNLYIVTKEAFANPTVYEAAAPLSAGKATMLVKVGSLDLPGLWGGFITGGDISPDGRRVVLCDYVQGYEMVLPSTSRNFNAIWNQPLTPVALGKRKQGEAVTYSLDGKALLATSEGRPAPLIQVARR